MGIRRKGDREGGRKTKKKGDKKGGGARREWDMGGRLGGAYLPSHHLCHGAAWEREVVGEARREMRVSGDGWVGGNSGGGWVGGRPGVRTPVSTTTHGANTELPEAAVPTPTISIQIGARAVMTVITSAA